MQTVPPTPPVNVNHLAFPTWDTAATRHFYCDVLGFRLIGAVKEERVPSTGEETPFLHTFYATSSGECIAFFDVEGLPPANPDGVPSWIRHFAFNVSSLADLDYWKARLNEHDIEVRGTVDHEGIWQSIYFFDPNGVRIEFTYQLRQLDESDAASAKLMVDEWCATH